MQPAAAQSPRPTHVRHVVLGPDCGGLHDHVHGPECSCRCTAGDPRRTWHLAPDDGMDHILLPTCLCTVPDPRRLAGRPLRRPPRSHPRVTWWSLFTGLTAMAWNAVSMLVIQVFFGLGEAGAFPIATRSLARWMRPTERGFAQGITHVRFAVGRRHDTAHRRSHHCEVRLAGRIYGVWRSRRRVVRGLVPLLSRHARGTRGRESGRARSDRRRAHAIHRNSLAQDSFARQSVDPRRDVLLLQLQSQRLQRLVFPPTCTIPAV